MGYELGIDLGTSFSSAAVHHRGDIRLVPLGSHATSIPSAVVTRPDGTVVIGEAAIEVASIDPDRLARGFKSRIGAPDPVIVGGAPFSAEVLTGRLLAGIVEKVTVAEGAAPSLICLTHPAGWSLYQLDLFEQAVAVSGLDRGLVRLLPEPEAAALGAVRSDPVAPGELVAVLDIGATSTRASVLRGTTGGFETVTPPDRIDGLGGLVFDGLVFDLVNRALGQVFDGADHSRPEVTSALFLVGQECNRAKEALSYRNGVTLSVVLPGATEEVDLSVGQLDQLLRPRLAQSVAALRRVLTAAGTDLDGPARLVVVGGSARIPLVARFLGAELGRAVQIGPDPQHVATIGAALHAGGCPARTDDDPIDATAPVPVGVSRQAAAGGAGPPLPGEETRLASYLPAGATAPALTRVAPVPLLPDGDDLTAPTPVTRHHDSDTAGTTPAPIPSPPDGDDLTAPTPVTRHHDSDTAGTTPAPIPSPPDDVDLTTPIPLGQRHTTDTDAGGTTLTATPATSDDVDLTAPIPLGQRHTTDTDAGGTAPASTPPPPDRSTPDRSAPDRSAPVPARRFGWDGDPPATDLASGRTTPIGGGTAGDGWPASPGGADPTIQIPAVGSWQPGADPGLAEGAGPGSADPTSTLDRDALRGPYSPVDSALYDPGPADPYGPDGVDPYGRGAGGRFATGGILDEWAPRRTGLFEDSPADSQPVDALAHRHVPGPFGRDDLPAIGLTDTQLHRAVGRSHRWEDPNLSERRNLPPMGVLIVAGGLVLLVLLVVAAAVLRGGDDNSTGAVLTTNSSPDDDLVRADEEQRTQLTGSVGSSVTTGSDTGAGSADDAAVPEDDDGDRDVSTTVKVDKPAGGNQTTTTVKATTTTLATTIDQTTTTARVTTTTLRVTTTEVPPSSTAPPGEGATG